MREFIVVGHKAITDGQFSLNDLPGSAGRMDIMCRCVNSALFLSHDLRRDVIIYLVLLGEPEPPKIVKFSGQDVRYLNPDERSSGSLIKKALELKARSRWKESTPGVWVRQGDLENLMSELNIVADEDNEGSIDEHTGNKLYYLHEDGTDIRDKMKETLPQSSTFILGDHVGMTSDEEQKIIDAGAQSINVGPLSLHADHCIIMVNNELDRKNNKKKGCD